MSLSRMEETGPDKELVKIFSLADERSAAHVFVGREDTIQAIDTNCRIAMWRVERGQAAEGKTFLVQGAPGAGKTSLMSRIKELWAGRKRDAPYVLDLTTDELSDISQLIRRIVSTVRSEWWQRVHNCFGVREAEVNVAALASARIEGKDKEGIGSFGILAKSIHRKNGRNLSASLSTRFRMSRRNMLPASECCMRAGTGSLSSRSMPVLPIPRRCLSISAFLARKSTTRISSGHCLQAR